jgi:5'-methylthioadenosine phosphorylase
MQKALKGSRELARAAAEIQVPVHEGACYVGMNGPRYETPAEIRMLAEAGADVVGMTASSEAIALAENGISYGCVAVVTNLGAGLGWGALHHGEVTDVMKERGPEVVRMLLRAAIGSVKSPLSSEED